LKGLGKEQVVESTVVVQLEEGETGRIRRVEDRWGGSLPEGTVANVGVSGE
jgi:hypothetical protein